MRELPSTLIFSRSEHSILWLCLSGRLYGARRRSVRGMHPRHVQGLRWQWCVRGLPSRHLFSPGCSIVWKYVRIMPCKLGFDCWKCILLLRGWIHWYWGSLYRLRAGQAQNRSRFRAMCQLPSRRVLRNPGSNHLSRVPKRLARRGWKL
jgi:hypothetical protein